MKLKCFFLVYTQIPNLSAFWSIQHVLLSWKPLGDRNNITYEYEVVYRIDSECSNDSFPDDGYTVYAPRTTNTSIEVFGLMSGTCYVFGVRAHISNNISGVISFISGATISEGNRHHSIIYLFHTHYNIQSSQIFHHLLKTHPV